MVINLMLKIEIKAKGDINKLDLVDWKEGGITKEDKNF